MCSSRHHRVRIDLTRFRQVVKLALRYIRPFDMIERIREVTYHLDLLPRLLGVRSVFQVSMLKTYDPDPSHVLEWSKVELEVDASY